MPDLIRLEALRQMQEWAASHEGETPPGSNLGPFVVHVLAPAGLTPPQPYCAAAMSMAFKNASQIVGKPMPFTYTAGALNMFRECRGLGFLMNEDETDIEPGDLIFWRRGLPHSGLGHVGIVEYGINEGRIQTVEANRASTVSHFHYMSGEWEHNFVGVIRVPG